MCDLNQSPLYNETPKKSTGIDTYCKPNSKRINTMGKQNRNNNKIYTYSKN